MGFLGGTDNHSHNDFCSFFVYSFKGKLAQWVKDKVKFHPRTYGNWDQCMFKCFQLLVRFLLLLFIYCVLFSFEFVCYTFGAILYVLIVIISTITCVIGLTYCKLGMSSQFVTFYQLTILNRKKSSAVLIFSKQNRGF